MNKIPPRATDLECTQLTPVNTHCSAVVKPIEQKPDPSNYSHHIMTFIWSLLFLMGFALVCIFIIRPTTR